jgi:hypothetical protein
MDGSERKGLLNLVDLAGSEKISKSGAEGIFFIFQENRLKKLTK